MATYKEVKGVTIQTLSEDPVIGGAAGGTWASSGNTNTARLGINGGAGTQTAGMIAGGNTAGGLTANTENYNGSTWTETGNLEATKRDVGLAGSQTAGLAVNGGPAVNSVQHFNGSSWTEGGDYPTAQDRTGVFGTQTAAVAFGGRTAPGAQQSTTFEYDGSSWTSGGTFITTGYNQASAGTYNAGIAMGGYAPGDGSSQIAGYYDGSSWTSISSLNTARAETGWSGRGTQTSSYIVGGTSPISGKTEAWNGSAWTEVADLGTSRNAMGSSGTLDAGFVAAGSVPGSPGFSQATEEFTTAPVTAAILTEGSVFLSGGTTLKGFGKAAGIPAGTWASGTDIPTANRSMGIFGPSTSTIIGGGYEPGGSATNAYSWNGSSWSDIAELNANKNEGVGYGNSSTSGFINKGTNEEWDGSSWTERNDLNTTRVLAAAAGSSTAALIAGGEVNPSAVTESWDGTSWTEVGDLNEGRYGAGLSGTQTAAIFATGIEYPGGSKTANAETWNGSSWTEGNNVNEARVRLGYSSKSVSIAMIFAGENASNAHSANTEIYNGTSWTEINNMSTARRSVAAGISGSASSGSLAIGGNPPTVATVEEWSVDNALGTITLS